MKNPWIIIGVITILLITGSVIYANKVSEENNVGVEVYSHIKGNPDSGVVLVEYADFQCPACASFQPVIKDLMEQYGEQIKFEFKHFPLPMHNLAEPAARAAEAAAQQGAFFEFHDLLFENQKGWSSSPNPMIQFSQYAEQLGLDKDKFRQHYNSSILKDKIRSDMREGRELGVNATPSLFLNGQKMNFGTAAEFVDQIEAALQPQVQFDLPPQI